VKLVKIVDGGFGLPGRGQFSHSLCPDVEPSNFRICPRKRSMQFLVTATLFFMLKKLDRGKRFIRDGVIGISGLVLLLSVLQFMSGPKITIDIWMMLWSSIPALWVILSVSKPVVTLWASGKQTVHSAELGLSRNRKIKRFHGTILRHIALLHTALRLRISTTKSRTCHCLGQRRPRLFLRTLFLSKFLNIACQWRRQNCL